MPTPASFSFIFGHFEQTIQFLQQINVKKCPSSKWRWDLNPQPFQHELSTITTRPGLLPLNFNLYTAPETRIYFSHIFVLKLILCFARLSKSTFCRLTHATPAALYAQSASRDWECDSFMTKKAGKNPFVNLIFVGTATHL